MNAFRITMGAYALLLLPLAYLAARLLTGLSMGWALRRGIISQVTHRSSHTIPTPRLGGVGLAGGFGLAAALLLGLLALWPAGREAMPFSPALVLWAGAGWLLMLVVGLLDDVYDLPALLKLGLMSLAAALPVLGGLRFDAAGLPLPGLLATLLLAALTLGWLLFFTNGYNFMDGMDGFAGNFARTAALFFFAALMLPVLRPILSGGELARLDFTLTAEAWLLPLLALACSGFLHWNRPPARVFMGDGGSLSTGYLLALYVVLGSRGALGAPLPASSALTILLPFVYDVVLTLIRRARMGQNLLQAHREHLYQRLLRTGQSHAQVLRLNVGLFVWCGALGAAGASAGATGGATSGAPLRGLALLLALAAMTAYWRHVVRRERARAGAVA